MANDVWKQYQGVIGFSIALLTFAGGGWAYLHSEFVQAQEFKQFQQSLEVRSLERDKKATETEVLKLEVKQEVYPKKFDAVDRAILKKHKEDLEEVKRELKEVKNRGANK